MGYALHNGVPASVSSFEAASTDLLFMYERVRTTPAPHRATVHTHTDTATRRRERGVVVRHVVVATLSQREREREKGVGKPGAVLCESCSVFTNSTTTEKCDENRHIHREPTTASATVKAIFRQSFLLVPRIRYQRTTVAPYPHTVFHSPSVQSFPQKFPDPAIHFHVKIFRIVIRFVSPTTCYLYPRDLSF